jgi:hypothetical protein
VFGALRTPEALRQAGLGSYETIGKKAAEDCRQEDSGIWTHELLRHNQGELIRLRNSMCAFLFRL